MIKNKRKSVLIMVVTSAVNLFSQDGLISGNMSLNNIFGFIVGVVLWVTALAIAWNCNAEGERLGPVIVSFFFPEVYLIWYVIRKYALKKTDYTC